MQQTYNKIIILTVFIVMGYSTIKSQEPITVTAKYCKSDVLSKEISDSDFIKVFRKEDQYIRYFLEHAVEGDTLKQAVVNKIDSRYTPLLIKNLSNDNDIYIEEIINGDGIKYTKFLGINIKKRYYGFTETDYQKIRMSDFARERLQRIFRPSLWNFTVPDADASTEEWQTWFEKYKIYM